MAGIVGYASSDDEDEHVVNAVPQKAEINETSAKPAEVQVTESASPRSPPPPAQTQATAPASQPDIQSKDPVVGPQPQNSVPLGPSLPTEAASGYLPEPEDDLISTQQSSAPSSPFTANRALLRDLTLPTVPNLDIPPSPPGSPAPALTKKLDNFLELKKKGIHFNGKLASSAAVQNPALMDKLMGFIEMGREEGGDSTREQYATTLSKDVWDPTGEETFPPWAFRGPLKQSQDRVRREKEAERTGGKRSGIEFVSSVSGASGTPGSAGTPETGGLSRGSKRKAGA